MSKCNTCKFNKGIKEFPECRKEIENEENDYMLLSTSELDSLYTEECRIYSEK